MVFWALFHLMWNGPVKPAPVPAPLMGLSHEAWDILLKKHVDEEGMVDYRGFKKDSAALNAYLDMLATHLPGPQTGREERLAYYINLYNAATVKLILDHYPLKSIRDIGHPWDKKWIPLGGELLSLGHIEHKILRKMGEPRIHFAINCASYSCPKLLNEAFTVARLEAQLEMATTSFIRDTTRNHIGTDALELSQIFQWYKADFTEGGSLIEYIRPYAPNPINPDAKISYRKYDWSLNENR